MLFRKVLLLHSITATLLCGVPILPVVAATMSWATVTALTGRLWGNEHLHQGRKIAMRRESREAESLPRKIPAIKAKFKKGQHVYKPKGYHFVGIVRAVFVTGGGEWRYVVETEGNFGLVHVFSGDQLKGRKAT
jgi:hypothetical protein